MHQATINRSKLLILILVFCFAGYMFRVAQAQDLITGGQPAEETFDSIVQTVVDFLRGIGDSVGGLLSRFIDFSWWRDTLVGIFYTVDDWVYKSFGLNLGEILNEIGKLLISIFDLIIEFAKKLWPF